MKKFLQDPAAWILLGTNLFILFHYIEFPGSIHTVIALFWLQSVLIGIFNVLDIFTVTHVVKDSYASNWSAGGVKIHAGLFFFLHYGFFHAAYLVILISTVIDIRKIDWPFMIFSFWFLVAGSAIGFIHNKIRNRTQAAHIGNMFIMPYARIIPMHFVILVPAFLHVSAPMVFIICKIIADMVMHVVYQKAIFKPMVSLNMQ